MTSGFSRQRHRIDQARETSDRAAERHRRQGAREFLDNRVTGENIQVRTSGGVQRDPLQRSDDPALLPSWSGVVTALATDDAGDQFVVLTDDSGRSSRITLDFACREDVELVAEQETLRAAAGALLAENRGRQR